MTLTHTQLHYAEFRFPINRTRYTSMDMDSCQGNTFTSEHRITNVLEYIEM